MHRQLGTIVGKSVKAGLMFRRGGGQALPGLVVEKLFPGYVTSMLAGLPEGAVIITGTNGKTTTTKMVVHLLRAGGKRVLTNSTGSNLTRGIASSISQNARISGRLPFDIAVLEIDEATARRLVRQIKPRWVLALNVSRDQLDRFGEVDTIADYIGAAMAEATQGIVANARDPHLLQRAERIALEKGIELELFGSSPALAEYFPTDYELAAIDQSVKTREKPVKTDVAVELAAFRENRVKYRVGKDIYAAQLKLAGQHNYLNGAAALALARRLLPDTAMKDLAKELENVSLAFGRGEKYRLKNGSVIELVLVKNPASFRQALASYGSKQQNLMIAINDNIADGRDVSWLWDVDFSTLSGRKIALTSGTRSADMALRLKYDDISVGRLEPDLHKAAEALAQEDGEKVILATYTAMLRLYAYLSKNGQRVL